jgi:hypothetical protein
MISRDSTEGSELGHTRIRRFAYSNTRAPGLVSSRALGRSWSLTSFLRAIVSWRKRDRYFDTGESGETYDAEMEAAAAGI